MGTIGSYNDKYHVTTERFQHRPGEVRLELWRRNEANGWSSNAHRWIECPEDDAEGDRNIERAAQEMISAAQARDVANVN